MKGGKMKRLTNAFGIRGLKASMSDKNILEELNERTAHFQFVNGISFSR